MENFETFGILIFHLFLNSDKCRDEKLFLTNEPKKDRLLTDSFFIQFTK